MSVKLNGWAKVGDQYAANGKWTIYRFKGKEFDTVDMFETFPADEPEKATKTYQSEADKMKRGAAWLVAPDGKIAAMIFLRPGEIR